MILAGLFSFNNGQERIQAQFPDLWNEVIDVIQTVDAGAYKTKVSEEITSSGKLFFSPKGLNSAFKYEFTQRGWQKQRENCDYPTNFYTPDYQPKPLTKRTQKPFREMDFVKNKIGVEVQFGKYAFMVYNVCAKMTIFRNLGHIDVGIEIVPVKQFAGEMSTGVSYFEQFVWDLQQRGISNIDVPVLVVGVDARPEDRRDVSEQDLMKSEPENQENDLLNNI